MMLFGKGVLEFKRFSASSMVWHVHLARYRRRMNSSATSRLPDMIFMNCRTKVSSAPSEFQFFASMAMSRIGSLKKPVASSPRKGKFASAVVVLPNSTSFDIRIQSSLLGLELFRLAVSAIFSLARVQ